MLLNIYIYIYIYVTTMFLSSITIIMVMNFRFDKLLYVGINEDKEDKIRILTALTRK